MAKEDPICSLCNGSHDVQEVHQRSGWGRTRTNWSPGTNSLCRRCRNKHNGHWMYKDVYRRRPPGKRGTRSRAS